MQTSKHLVIIFLYGSLLAGCTPNDPPVITPVVPPPVISCDACALAPVAADKHTYPDAIRSSFDYSLFQLPDSQLTKMSTLGLIQTIEHTARVMDMELFTGVLDSRDRVLKKLNTSHTLNKRPDAGAAILDYYKKKAPCCVDLIADTTSKLGFLVVWGHFDLICTQDSILTTLTAAQKKDFVKTVLAKYDERIKSPLYLSQPGGRGCAMLLLHALMQAAVYAPYMNALVNDGEIAMFSKISWINLALSSDSVRDKVLQYARQYAVS